MLKQSETVGELFKAIVNFNTTFNGLDRDAKNPFFKSKYISFDAIVGLRGELAKSGLATIQSIGTTEDGLATKITSMLIHKTGEWILSEPLILKPVKADPQGLGSAISYGKRYQLAGMLGVAETIDDDGNEAQGLNNTPASQNTFNNNANVQKNNANVQQNNAAMIDELQTARMSALIKEKKFDRNTAIEICKKATGKTSAADLTWNEAEKVIKAYEAYTA